MNLNNPITFTPPNLTKKDGTVKSFNPITLKELDITLIDNAKRKSVVAQIRPCPKPLILWEKQSYDEIGDYTQSQAEARILELLSNDPASVLSNLFYRN